MAIKVKYQCLSRITLIVLAALPTISCGSLPFLSTPTPMPTQTFTSSPTFTPTTTFTPLPTSTPTATLTPTATPVHFETVNRADGSMLVADQVVGYQFVLAKGWQEINPLNSLWYEAEYFGGQNFLSLSISMQEREGALDYELLKRTTQNVGDLDKLLANGITTNGYGTTLGYLKYKNFLYGSIHGYVYQDEYEILFIVEDQVITIHFFRKSPIPSGDTYLQVIRAIQNSIQIK